MAHLASGGFRHHAAREPTPRRLAYRMTEQRETWSGRGGSSSRPSARPWPSGSIWKFLKSVPMAAPLVFFYAGLIFVVVP
jgi:hypothetical protein